MIHCENATLGTCIIQSDWNLAIRPPCHLISIEYCQLIKVHAFTLSWLLLCTVGSKTEELKNFYSAILAIHLTPVDGYIKVES